LISFGNKPNLLTGLIPEKIFYPQGCYRKLDNNLPLKNREKEGGAHGRR
jgi:hypothetical protein